MTPTTIRLLKEVERVLDGSGSETRDVVLQDNECGANHGGKYFDAVRGEGEDVGCACWGVLSADQASLRAQSPRHPLCVWSSIGECLCYLTFEITA